MARLTVGGCLGRIGGITRGGAGTAERCRYGRKPNLGLSGVPRRQHGEGMRHCYLLNLVTTREHSNQN